MSQQTSKRFSVRWGSGLLVVALGLMSSQLRCADANNHFMDDGDPMLTGDGGTKTDMADGLCFMGTPQTESQLLNRCTDAERIERGSHIPSSTWDGTSSLPYSS